MTKSKRQLLARAVCTWTVLAGGMASAETGKPQLDYAKSRLAAAEQDVEFRLVNDLDHPEAFRIQTSGGQSVIEANSPAGLIYGAQAVARGEVLSGQVERPDFDLRGTILWLGGEVQGPRMAPYYSGFDAERLPWFFDRPFMTRYLDSLASARYNTLFLWASHPFPYLLELPDYPEATRLTPEQLRQNQEQFRWFASECSRRNIRILLHFYNIHLPSGLSEKFEARPPAWGTSTVSRPTPEIARYYRYVLGRYFEEFDSIGLYICPGETLELGRFVTDSQMYVLATQALRHKVQAAILKEQILHTGHATDLGREFRKQMEQSVEVYKRLAELTDGTYRNANDLMGRHWKREGLAEFEKDLAEQQAWLDAL